ncbi:MAG: hypothetical protein ABIU63_11790 [Chitinophagaceae bacterium]
MIAGASPTASAFCTQFAIFTAMRRTCYIVILLVLAMTLRASEQTLFLQLTACGSTLPQTFHAVFSPQNDLVKKTIASDPIAMPVFSSNQQVLKTVVTPGQQHCIFFVKLSQEVLPLPARAAPGNNQLLHNYSFHSFW